MKEINLDEIINSIIGNPDADKIHRESCKDAMLDFGRQLLAAAADNAKIKSVMPNHFGVIEEIDKDSITSVIEAVK